MAEEKKQESGNRAVGVYLHKNEIEELDRIAEDLNVKRGKLLRFSVLAFLKQYKEGKIEVETQTITTKTLKLP